MIFDGAKGRIVSSMDTGEYGLQPEYSEAQWGYLESGVMAYVVGFGLLHLTEMSSDLTFVRRGSLGKGALELD